MIKCHYYKYRKNQKKKKKKEKSLHHASITSTPRPDHTEDINDCELSMFAVKAKISGVLYNPASSIDFSLIGPGCAGRA